MVAAGKAQHVVLRSPFRRGLPRGRPSSGAGRGGRARRIAATLAGGAGKRAHRAQAPDPTGRAPLRAGGAGMRTKAWPAVLGQMLTLQRTSKTRRPVNISCALTRDISVGTSAIRVARVRSLSGRRRLPITRGSFL